MQHLKILLASAMMLTLFISQAQDKIAPGKMIDVGGYDLHFNVSGSGDKTIVIETGTGSWSLQWMEFQENLSKHFTVVTYDRAGYGWSDPSPYSRTANIIVEELHLGLEKLGITSKPFILLGHSYGGMIVKAFANKYPDEVGAIILADAASEYQFEKLPTMVKMVVEGGKKQFKETGSMARNGLIIASQMPIDSTLAERYWSTYQKSIARASYYDAMFNEMELLPMTYIHSEIAKPMIKPLLVITSGNSFGAFDKIPGMPIDDSNEVWFQLQKDLLKTSTNSEQALIKEATHDLLLSSPEEFTDEVIRFVKAL